MFRKPFKVKTSTTMKGSDKRRLRSMIEVQYPNLTTEDINILIPNKSEVNQAKAMTHSGSIAMIYYAGHNPIFLQVEELCYPTVYTLWKYPGLLPTVVTLPVVLDKICNGADLMAPGVILNETTAPELANLKVNNMCAIRIIGNKSPIAVGIAMMCEDDLNTEGIKGKAVTITHCYRDTLWLCGDQADPPLVLDNELKELTEEMQDVNISETSFASNTINSNELPEAQASDIDSVESNANEINKDICSQYSMDDILHNSFMTALKVHGKKIQLPVLTSTFYSAHVLKSCPPELNLDIKKTTYKKLSVYLKKMQKEGIVQIKELTKGVESIVSINGENESLKSFSLDLVFKNHIVAQKAEKSVDVLPSANIQENYKFPSVTELFVVSAQVKTVFEFCHIRKGDIITYSAVRDALKHYVKENSLQNEQNPREVVLDPVLCDCVSRKGDYKSIMTWEEIYEATVSKMPHAYQIVFGEKAPIIKKGKLEPIQVSVDIRTGNKKVTLIQNLETYGINPEKLAQHVQVAVAASTSIASTQNGKGSVVLIQGNQVRYLQKLFLDIYKVPRKYLQGLENVPPKKK